MSTTPRGDAFAALMERQIKALDDHIYDPLMRVYQSGVMERSVAGQVIDKADRINGLIAKWKPILELHEWDIRYNPDKHILRSRSAEVTYNDHGKAASIRIAEDLPYKHLEQAVLHELIHVAMRSYSEQADRMLVHVRGGRARTHLHEMLEDVEEAFIERMVRALMPGASRITVMPGRKWSEQTWGPWK